jgi:hypothetical protein
MKSRKLRKLTALATAFALTISMIGATSNDSLNSIQARLRSPDFEVAYVTSHMERNMVFNADVVVVDFTDIETISSVARELVDDGKMLYVTNPEVIAEDLAQILSIPRDVTTSYMELVLIAYSIYRIGDIYVFENHWVDLGENVVEIDPSETPRIRLSDFNNISIISHEDYIDESEIQVPPPLGYSNFYNVTTVREFTETRSINDLGISVADDVAQAYESARSSLAE